MLRSLSGQTHEVITSVCFKTSAKLKTINSITKVTFKQLSNSEINYYIKNFKVLDKAGSYGIQDWIGQIAVTKIEGSYFNVMGFPMDKIYNTLLTF
jgi:septum formation protein